MSTRSQPEVVIIGAGPAGLTAAYELASAGVLATVLEADDVVGGISRTVERDGWRFDIGGHRFFTKVARVEALWREVLPGGEFLRRPRRSRILYRGRFFDYPLRPWGALRSLGATEALRCVLSYVWARLRPPADQSHLEGWVAARFGYRLYRHFFKTYNEKVWGVAATEIQSDWAAQRIKNLSLANALLGGLRPGRNQREITSLIEEFDYPRLGPGMMWERCCELVEAAGSKVHLGQPVTRIRHRDGRAVAVETTADGAVSDYPCTDLVSSMPLPDLVRAMDPSAPPEVLAAADGLRFRDFLTVALVVPAAGAFGDNWIYVHSPEVRVGRIQNFGAWSQWMVKPGHTCLGCEYFVFAGDELWDLPDAHLVDLATRELNWLGLVGPGPVEAGYVVRMPKAYPVYDQGFHHGVAALRGWLAAHAANVHPVGRNGMHRYNNQDHSMLTAMLTVENILTGAGHDTWSVNVEGEYHEQATAGRTTAGRTTAGRTTAGRTAVSGTGRDAPILPATRSPRDRRPGPGRHGPTGGSGRPPGSG
jgi:protoporphyrinogen oxidase